MTFLLKKKALKRLVSSLTMLTTVVSMTGMMALSSITIAAEGIVDGDLIKSNATNSDGTPTYESLDIYIVKIVGTKQFKRLVLNPTVFESYGHLNYGDVQTIDQADMDTYTTSSLVRVDTDPDEKVYAMTPDGDIGSKSWLNLTTAEATSVTGYDAEGVYTINETDGGNYNTVGDVTTPAQLTTFYADGTLPEGEGTPPVPVTGTLTVSLAATTPVAATYVRDTGAIVAQSTADFLAVNFTAPTDGDVTVTNLKVNRTGIAADSDLGTIYLYDGNTEIAQHASFSSKVITFNDASGLFTVDAGTTKTINVRADISAANANVSSIVLGIANAASVTANADSVGGSFPINGNAMAVTTVADLGYLNISSFTTFPATIDPGQTDKELWRFNVQANDQEMSIDKIKMTVVGTIAINDIENFKLMVGATELAAVASLNDSKEIVFDLSASPYTLTSGQTKTMVVKGDVVNGSGRAFKFTIRQVGDVTVTDNGYGVSVAPLNTGAAFTLIDADTAGDGTNINNGNLSIQLAADSPSGNVAAGATGVSLAKFEYTANGEDIKVTAIKVSVNEENNDRVIDNGKLYWNGSQIGTTDAAVADETTVTTTTTQIITAGETATIEYRADMTYTAGTALAAGQTIVVSLVAGTTDATGQSSLANVATSAATGKTITVATGIVTVAENLTVADATNSLPTAVKAATGAKIGSFVLTAGSGEGASVSQIELTDNVASTEAASVAFVLAAATDLDATATGTTSGTLTTAVTDSLVIGETYKAMSAGGNTLPATIIIRTKPTTTTVTYDVTVAATTTGTSTTATIRSGASTDVDTLADTFQNLKLMMGTTQVGTTISNLTDTAATAYTFTPSTAIEIAAGQQVVFDVLADVKSSGMTLSVNSDTTGVIAHTLTTATGLDTGNTANTATATTTLQNVYISGVGTLVTSVASDTPDTAQVVMGATGVEIAKFKFTETANSEDLDLSQIAVTDGGGSFGSLSNIKLMDGTTTLATVATLTAGGVATFPTLNVIVPKGGSKTLTVQADITAYPGATSASTHVLSIATSGVTGTGVSSGTSLGASVASTGTAGTMTVYKTKITVAKDAASPEGEKSPSVDQTVLIFNVTNASNVANQDATIEDLAINLATSGTWLVATARDIRVYKNSISTANQVGIVTFAGGAAAPLASVAFGGWTAGTLTDVAISSGDTVKFYVTVDTNEAPSTTGRITVSVPTTNGVKWTDGVTTGIVVVNELSLTGGTITY